MSKDCSSGESGGQDSSAGGSPGDGAVKDVNASIYESKEPKKIVRIITVMAYMFSVSFVAIVLSAYYIFLWEPPNPRLMHANAIRLRADPQLNFLRVELPSKSHLEETISRDSSSRNNNSIERTRERVQERTPDYDGFEESLTSLKTTLAELIRERSNDNDSSSIEQYFVIRGNDENYEKINEKINSRWKNLRKSYNSTRNLSDRREKKDELVDTTLTDKIIYNNSMDDQGRNEEEENDKESKSKMQLPRKMSAQNVVASITRTLGTREKVQANEIRFAGEERKDKLYEPKHKKKLVRVLTVIAYIIFVSMAAILLSLYYTYIWDPENQAVRTRAHKPDCATIKTSDSLTIASVSYETQIEKVTAKSTTNDTMDDTTEISITTLRDKSLLQILTETIKSKEVLPYASSSVASTDLQMVDVVTITEPYDENISRN
ncbi:hypothetical protein HZH68_003682 [Vespula germanica]|uniref:Uncharacterized protein n=1 Tax=Vespula germanica TaxID=30212 RepID=A0A834NPP4_VESGE|nr:hypothetical protein HZH68_003682 [Vespula germanica]